MSKKSQKRQSVIVSLSDKNLDDLQKLEKERDELMKDFEERKSCMFDWILQGQYLYICKLSLLFGKCFVGE